MKIGILTYHSSHNYGAFLQAYALSHAIREQTGNETEIISYTMQKAVDRNNHLVKRNWKSLFALIYYQRRYHVFEESIRQYQILSSETVISDDVQDVIKLIDGKYDLVIVGSDEVWKMDSYRGFPTPYWLPGNITCPKYTYAVSSRINPQKVDAKQKELLKKLIPDFDYIGVRDEVTKEFVASFASEHQEIHVQCDPAFAYNFRTSKEIGKSLIRRKFGVDGKKKCIALMMGHSALAKQIIRVYGHKFDFISLYWYYPGTKGFAVLNPFEWMEAIAGADGLITDYFHGMVFALKNNTPFISFERREIESPKYSKAYDLLARYGLTDHFFMITNPEEQTYREVGAFLADIISGKAKNDFQEVCENERKSFLEFCEQLPDLKPKKIEITHKDECCGCSACEFVCPVEAIHMRTDDEGFAYPEVDEKLCVDCGKCKSVCSFIRNKVDDSIWNEPKSVYAVKHLSNDVRSCSQSGGMFTAISDVILNDNGSVYGCTLKEPGKALHIKARTPSERDQLRGSKYIQSSLDDIYSEIISDLKEDKEVLFTGTPCQVAAVKKVMEPYDTSKLYYVDLICHGVVSPMVWGEYVAFLEKKYQGKVTKAIFRDKQFGWRGRKETFRIDGKEHSDTVFRDLYSSHYITRPSCFACPFKKTERVGDITIGDYWGINKVIPSFEDNNGVSEVIINNDKGHELFEKCSKDLEIRETTIADAMQNSLKRCYSMPYGRDRFWRQHNKEGIKGYVREREILIAKRRIKSNIKKWVDSTKYNVKQTIRKMLIKES